IVRWGLGSIALARQINLLPSPDRAAEQALSPKLNRAITYRLNSPPPASCGILRTYGTGTGQASLISGHAACGHAKSDPGTIRPFGPLARDCSKARRGHLFRKCSQEGNSFGSPVLRVPLIA